MAPTRDVPSLGVVVTGGIGVLVVIAFVAGVVLGRDASPQPGERVAVVRDDAGAIEVLAARCEDERVRAVAVQDTDGRDLWRVESAKGTIDRRFVVGGEPPAFFETTVALDEPLPASGLLVAEVAVDDVVDARPFDPADVDDGDGFGLSCRDGGIGLVSVLFVAGAAGVVAAYGAVVARYVRRP